MHRHPQILASLVVLATLAVGCGAGYTERATRAAHRPPRALTQAEVMRVRLRTPRAQALAQLGPPSARGPSTIPGGYRCLYWRIVSQPPTALWRLCFRDGRLQVLSTYLL